MTGVTNARVEYRGANSGKVFWFFTSNPWTGECHAECSNGAISIVGGGNNNTVKFVCGPKYMKEQ